MKAWTKAVGRVRPLEPKKAPLIDRTSEMTRAKMTGVVSATTKAMVKAVTRAVRRVQPLEPMKDDLLGPAMEAGSECALAVVTVPTRDKA